MKRKSKTIKKIILIILLIWLGLILLNRILSAVLVNKFNVDTALEDAFGVDENSLKDSDFYDSVEEVIKNSKERIDSGLKTENLYKCNMDQIIFKAENENYASVYYEAIKDKTEVCFIFAKFKVKNINGTRMYAYLTHTETEYSSSDSKVNNAQDSLDSALRYSSIDQYFNINPDNTRFVYGVICKNSLVDSQSIENLQVEGQNPDDIIEYEYLGDTYYFWYYMNLKSKKPASELVGTLE